VRRHRFLWIQFSEIAQPQPEAIAIIGIAGFLFQDLRQNLFFSFCPMS
jgi:hypothetical protein